MNAGEDVSPYGAAYYIGKTVLWDIAIRNQGVVTVTVKVLDAKEKFGRVDLLVETDTGSVRFFKPVRL